MNLPNLIRESLQLRILIAKPLKLLALSMRDFTVNPRDHPRLKPLVIRRGMIARFAHLLWFIQVSTVGGLHAPVAQ